MYRIKIILFFILAFSISNCYSQLLPLSKNATVTLITCGSGAEIYSLFGHTAIRIKDDEMHIDQVYNYGTFDFNTPNFYLKFVRGNLQYMASSNSFNDFMNEYQLDHRSVYEQVLNFSQQQKQQLFDDLNRALVSSERYYTYKFIDKNCTTMVLDILNKTLGQKVLVKTRDTDKTYREILFPYFVDHFYTNLGISIFFGRKVDLMGERIFLPSELHDSAAKAVYNGQPLVVENRAIIEFPPLKVPMSWWDNLYSLSLLMVLVVIANNNKIYVMFFFVFGLLGLFFSLAGFYSLHKELESNYNILLFNPLLLVLVYFYLKNNIKGSYIVSLLCLASLAVYGIIMAYKIHLFIVLPLIIASVTGLIKIALMNRKLLASVKQDGA